MSAIPIKKISYTHDAMVDLLVQNPGISQGQLAIHFGYTQTWVSIVMASDAFKERLAARRQELIDPAILATIEERFEAVATRSLEVLQEKLSQPFTQVPDQLALQAAALGARGLGKGGFGGNNSQVNVQVNVDAKERLARVAERLTTLVRENREGVVDGQASEGTA